MDATRKQDRERAGGVDAGACIVHSLNTCSPGAITAQDLDNEIDGLYLEMRPYPKEYCGIVGQTWHQSCIYRALCKKHGVHNVKWAKLSVSSIYKRGIGMLYVHGILNYRLFGNDPSGNWQHTIAIDTNNRKVREMNYEPEWQEFSDCFTQGKSKRMNLMSQIWQVYSLEIIDSELESIDGLPSDDDDSGDETESVDYSHCIPNSNREIIACDVLANMRPIEQTRKRKLAKEVNGCDEPSIFSGCNCLVYQLEESRDGVV